MRDGLYDAIRMSNGDRGFRDWPAHGDVGFWDRDPSALLQKFAPELRRYAMAQTLAHDAHMTLSRTTAERARIIALRRFADWDAPTPTRGRARRRSYPTTSWAHHPRERIRKGSRGAMASSIHGRRTPTSSTCGSTRHSRNTTGSGSITRMASCAHGSIGRGPPIPKRPSAPGPASTSRPIGRTIPRSPPTRSRAPDPARPSRATLRR